MSDISVINKLSKGMNDYKFTVWTDAFRGVDKLCVTSVEGETYHQFGTGDTFESACSDLYNRIRFCKIKEICKYSDSINVTCARFNITEKELNKITNKENLNENISRD